METSGYSNVPGPGPGEQPVEAPRHGPQPDYGFFEPAPFPSPDVAAPTAQPVAEPVVESVPEPVAETVATPVVDAVVETVPKPVAEPVVESVPEPVVESVPEPVVETVPEPVVESVPEPVVESVPEPVVETVPEPVVETVPEPVVETVPEPVAEPVVDAVVETVPEPAAEAIVESVPEPVLVEPSVAEPASSMVGSPVEGLPMSLAIAAQEAAEVDLSVPEPPQSVDYSAFNGMAEPGAVDLADLASEPSVEYDGGYDGGLDATVLLEDAAVGLAESEAEESAYHRLSTEATASDDIVLVDLLLQVLERKASDLHLSAGARPTIRINGELIQLEEYPVLTPPVIQRVMYAAITQRQREKFEENLELDFAYSVPGRARFRVNVYRQRDAVGAAFRLIPFEIKKLEDLGVPPQVANFSMLPRGFVLVTGPTGSGKSTTLASLLDLANRNRKDHIMTVEDPIEFLHRHQSCLVNQREVGEDTLSFQNALKHVLRQDPDIILVGEMRDLETISVALTAAETGHLVYATLHTQDAAQTIDRVIDVFPPHQQQQIRAQLATSIQGVVCQTLARSADGRSRVVACEVMVATPAIRNLIREGKTHQIYSAMQAGGKFGMQTMDQHLAELVNKGRITYETGLEKCHHIEDFNRLTGRI